MGGIIGGVIGGIGSLIGGSTAASDALKGFNYLKKNTQGYVNSGNTANTDITGLLTSTPNSPAAKSAFANYLSSTGYDFAKQQGTNAITGSAAARGLLNSGSTAKALATFGSNLAQQHFNDYMAQLQDLSKTGLQAAGQIGQAGTAGGQVAAQAQAGGIAGATGAAQGIVNPIMNLFGGVSSPNDIQPVTVTPSIFGQY